MRAFIAIALPDTVRESLRQLQQELAQSRADVKWVEPANLHLTLKFLDEIAEDQRQQVEAMLGEMASRESTFTLQLEQVGAFPSMSAPRIMWVGIAQGKDALTRMGEAIEQQARSLGLRREERPFSCHLTLGRVRSPRGLKELAKQLRTVQWTAPAPWRVSAVTLYYSTLSSSGPHYNVLAEVPLER